MRITAMENLLLGFIGLLFVIDSIEALFLISHLQVSTVE